MYRFDTPEAAAVIETMDDILPEVPIKAADAIARIQAALPTSTRRSIEQRWASHRDHWIATGQMRKIGHGLYCWQIPPADALVFQ